MRNKPYDFYDLPRIADLKCLVNEKANQIPNQIAFRYPVGRTQVEQKTFREFKEDVEALGTWQFQKGWRNRHIAVIGENSYEWLVVFFATVNGGNVAVAIDKELPSKEVQNLIQYGDVDIVFCSEMYIDLVQEIPNLLVYELKEISAFMEEGRKKIKDGYMDYRNYQIRRNEMCCILFTSGTSGASKGVMLSQSNLAEEINNTGGLFLLEGEMVALLPFHHAFGLVLSVMMVLHYGYSVYINRSLKQVKRTLIEAKPQTLVLVPLYVETFHKQIWETVNARGKGKPLRLLMKLSDGLLRIGIDVRKRWFATVREAFGGKLEYIICGGAPLEVRYIREFRSWGIEIINGYGTTECSPCIAGNRNYYHKDGTVGVPLPNTELRIGEDGEVMVKGGHVMLGYYKDEAATAEAFRDGWYATGDLGYIDEDGFLTLTGRKKNLIILSNGENVSPEELESDFLKYEAVQEVLVYEQNQGIVAEIYPDADYLKEHVRAGTIQEYFDRIRVEVNRSRPIYKQVVMIRLRDSEFPKNTSKKILRY